METKPSPEIFNLSIGNKRQVTLPSPLLRRLSLREGDRLQVVMHGDQIMLVPMVSVPRHLVSPELLEEMNARRGPRPDDIPLAEFAAQVRQSAKRDLAQRKAASQEPEEVCQVEQKYMTAE